MHINLINKKLLFGNYKVKCAVGKRGISKFKKEGDKRTPKGIFSFKNVLYRKDRVLNIKTNLKKIVIKKNMGWCDDSSSKNYNKLITFPFRYRAERLYKKNNIYDIILVISYNIKPIVKKKGSAIFLHIATKKYKPTDGCISIAKKDMKILLNNVNKKTKIIIH